MMINWLFPEWVQRWVKGLFRLRPPSSGIVSLLRLKKLNLHSHFGKKWRLYISAKPFHPKSSVSRHAGSMNWNVKLTMIIEPDSDFSAPLSSGHRGLRHIRSFSFHFISSKNFFVVCFPYYVFYHLVFFLFNIFFINFDNKLFFLPTFSTNFFFWLLWRQTIFFNFFLPPPPPRYQMVRP